MVHDLGSLIFEVSKDTLAKDKSIYQTKILQGVAWKIHIALDGEGLDQTLGVYIGPQLKPSLAPVTVKFKMTVLNQRRNRTKKTFEISKVFDQKILEKKLTWGMPKVFPVNTMPNVDGSYLFEFILLTLKIESPNMIGLLSSLCQDDSRVVSSHRENEQLRHELSIYKRELLEVQQERDDQLAIIASLQKLSASSGSVSPPLLKKRKKDEPGEEDPEVEVVKEVRELVWNEELIKSVLERNNLDEMKHVLEQFENGTTKLKGAIKEANKCRICWEAPRSVVFMPCSHMTCCAACAKLTEQCPICRKAKESIIEPFIS